jgi:flagellar L-ring protein precursor FlgH
VAALLGVIISSPCAWARGKDSKRDSLTQYIQRAEAAPKIEQRGYPGSIWRDSGQLSNLVADYKAHAVGDQVTILIVQDTTATNTANVATDRSFQASSGIDALPGHINTSGIQNLFSPHSSATLQGKAQASSKSSLRTSLAGRVVAVLESGSLVLEAERSVTMNNERQTVLLRGIARPGDISPDNAVVSNDLSNLELELKGKGVVSEGVRPPNFFVRMLLRLLGF